MYIKKLTIWLFMLLALVSTACSDIRDIVGGGTQDLPSDGVVLTLKLPNFTKNTVATRANEQQQINSLCVLCYDAGDNYLGMSTISSDSIKDKGDDTYDVKVKAVPGTATLHIVANTTITKSDARDADGKNNLYNATRGGNPNLDAPVCWGSVKVDSLLSGSPKVWLFRQFAKASVIKDDTKVKNFEITGFKLFNTATKGTILGVCGKQTVLGNAEEATITFVTTKPEDSKYNDFSVVSHDPWITVPTDYKSEASYINLPTTAGPNSSTGRLYTIKLTLSKNCESYAHTGIVTITSGDLSLDVLITQKGYDFRTDPNRIVRIRDLENKSSDLNQDDYFSWIDSKQFQGIRPEENQGRVRNDGLHFFVGKNQVYYLIPKLQGDKLTCNDTRVKVDEKSVNGFYKVMLANNSDESYNDNNYNRWISDEAFTIITITNNRTNITVSYPVYHVGLFAKLTTAYQLGNSKASGWYYYEMVDVKAKVTKTDGTTEVRTYHMLDRNLGATNNGYYSPATTALEGNKGAIGGYFKISVAENSNDAKNQNTVVDALAIGDFKVCDNMCLRGLIDNNNNLAIVEEKTHYGEVYNCLRINTDERDIPQIFIPMSGYYEGKTDEDAIYKDSNHANLWTSSRLAGYQGFSESSPEYGFWYLYLDAFGKSLNLSNYRFVTGSSGNNTKRYRAMPVRLAAEQK